MRVERAARVAVVPMALFAILYYSIVPFPTDLLAGVWFVDAVGPSRSLHLLAYGGLTGLVLLAIRSPDRSAVFLAVGVSVSFGAGMELVQLTLPHRTFSLTDIAVNAAAALFAGWCWYAAARLRTRYSSQGSRMSRTSSPR